MPAKNALDYHDYYVQQIMNDWKSFTEFVFSNQYSEFDFSEAKAKMEMPLVPKQVGQKFVSIKGYIDIFVTGVMAKPANSEDHFWSRLDYPIEVKSHIKSITETMRQINTHRAYMRPGVDYVLASPDNRFIDLLESQDVNYIELEKTNLEPNNPDVDSLL